MSMHTPVNMRVQVADKGNATVYFTNVNYAGEGHPPVMGAISPAMVTNCRMVFRQEGRRGVAYRAVRQEAACLLRNDPFVNKQLLKSNELRHTHFPPAPNGEVYWFLPAPPRSAISRRAPPLYGIGPFINAAFSRRSAWSRAQLSIRHHNHRTRSWCALQRCRSVQLVDRSWSPRVVELDRSSSMTGSFALLSTTTGD